MLCVRGSLGLRQDIAAYLSNVEADLYQITTYKVGRGKGERLTVHFSLIQSVQKFVAENFLRKTIVDPLNII